MAKEKNLVLTKDFFDDLDIITMEYQKDGAELVLCFLKLSLYSCENNNKLYLKSNPINDKTQLPILARLVNHDPAQLKKAMQYFVENSLVEFVEEEGKVLLVIKKSIFE